jgi:hypothetical protein
MLRWFTVVIQFAKCRNLNQWRQMNATCAGSRSPSGVIVKHSSIDPDVSVQKPMHPSLAPSQTVFSFPSTGTLELESPVVSGSPVKSRPRSASAARRPKPLSGPRDAHGTPTVKHTFGRVIEPKLAYTAKPPPTKAEIVQMLEPSKLDLRPASRALTKYGCPIP